MDDHDVLYNFGFDSSGNAAVDNILAAIAMAGRACHNTEDWYLGSPAPVEFIQDAANDLADYVNSLERPLAPPASS